MTAYEKVAFVHWEGPPAKPQQVVFEGPDCVDQAEKWAHENLRTTKHWREHPHVDGVCPLCYPTGN